jgi:hypothetical protein
MISRFASTTVMLLVPVAALGLLGYTSLHVGQSPAMEAGGPRGQKPGKSHRSPGVVGDDIELRLSNWHYTAHGPTDTGKK